MLMWTMKWTWNRHQLQVFRTNYFASMHTNVFWWRPVCIYMVHDDLWRIFQNYCRSSSIFLLHHLFYIIFIKGKEEQQATLGGKLESFMLWRGIIYSWPEKETVVNWLKGSQYLLSYYSCWCILALLENLSWLWQWSSEGTSATKCLCILVFNIC